MKKMISRRNFLKACAIAGSAAALTACGGGSSSSTAAGSTAGSGSAASSSGPEPSGPYFSSDSSTRCSSWGVIPPQFQRAEK